MATRPRKTTRARARAARPRRAVRKPRAVRAKLGTYRAKRRFDVTPEPSGAARPAPDAAWSYVIQEHDARRLHYDFRLELDGVLLSWAVPKGPSLVPGAKRLAVRTEDHPIDYRDFEGIIPEGEYGGGTVVVWDRGRWTPEGDARDMLARGRLTFTLDGAKLRGRWHLVRTAGRGGRDQADNWLLFKGRDEAARERGPEIVDERPESVISGRTVAEVARDADRVWHSNRSEAAAPAAPEGLESLVAALPTDLPLTNLDKVLWPDDGYTKAQLLAYIAVTAEHALPWLARRPLTLVRCPDGVTGECWFQKHAGKGTPASIARVTIREDDGREREYMYVDDQRGLLAVAQLGALELHTWGARVDQLERPDLLVFDLDPDPSVAWPRVAEAALDLRARLDGLGLASWVKTTGGKGLHVCVPVARRAGWDDTKAFTRAVAERMVADEPARFTANMSKRARGGKIFVDYLRNARGATFIAPYSPRRRAGAPVATPLAWAELEAGVDPASFTILSVPVRLGALHADPWAELASSRQTITAAARRAVGLR